MFMSIKEQIHEIAEKLPENASFEDAMYAMYVRMKFEQGKKDIDMGRFLSTEDARKKLLRWQK